MWQLLTNCVPVCSQLADRHCHPNRTCPRCGQHEETVNHMLFECPFATQTWSLETLPIDPGEFPRPSIFDNFDYLLHRIHKRNGTEECLARIPWILWFLWKARNEKVFNNKDISPLEVIQSAASEAASRRVAVDTSWKEEDARYGGGFVMENEDGSTLFGSFASNRVLSPLHAEFGTLLWAMKSSLTLGHVSMAFESDRMQLVRLIEEEEEWPNLMAVFDEFFNLCSWFVFCSISFVSRLKNLRADCLAKGARSHGFFLSHVHSEVPTWLVPDTTWLESS
ncbi:hypothetical protein DY000_02054171 [Brassica cretica]|uniref:RNase H type-1 domain-containing protein n=1 Tax=Brassica cretica TaxID=69181 RepID=A0ABQ7ACU5_BRACR|nr:hypothetical protein DY000_02054171 [Brassica cretica]